MSDLRLQGEVSLSAEGAESALERVGERAGRMASRVQQGAQKAGEAVDNIGAGANGTADEFTRAEGRIVQSIKRIQTNMELAGKTASQRIEWQINDKGFDPAKFEPLLARLREVEAAQAKVGISAGQMRASLAGVPAQFTDIVTSLASGQQPMTVLLQQGGQLKDMFGGVGNAVKALGGYVAGLVNPYTVAAAGLAAFAVAAHQGAEESRALSRELILSGNAAGTSVDNLKNMAASVAASSGATKGAVTEALGQIVATGKVSESSMGAVADAAVKMERATGKAVKDSVKEFEELGRSPVDASVKLNEQYSYLTASIYRQIKALEDQGKKQEAADLAQKAYASAMAERATTIKAELGSLETAWKNVGDWAKSAWDKMLNVGREASVEQQIATLKKQLETGSFDFALSESDIRSQIAALEKKLKTDKEITQEKAKQGEAEKANIRWLAEADKYLTREQQLVRETTRIRNEGLAAGIPEAEIQKRISKMREDYDRSIAQANADGLINQAKANAKRYGDYYKQELDQFRLATGDYIAAMAALEKRALEVEREAVERERPADAAGRIQKKNRLAALDEQMADVARRQAAAMEDAAQKTQGVLEKMAVAAGKQLDPLEQAGREFVERWGKDMQRAAVDGNDAVIAAGQALWASMAGDAQFKAAKEKFDALFADLQAQLEKAKQEAARDGGFLAGISGAVQADQIRDRLMPAIRDAQREMESTAGNSLVNQKAVAETRKNIEQAAAAGSEAWRKFTDDIERSLTDALMRGFENGNSFGENFVKTLRNTLKTAALKIAVQAIVSPIMGGVRELLGGAAGSLLSGGASSGGVAGGLGSAVGSSTSLLGALSTANTLYNLPTNASILGQWLGGGMSTANASGTIFANTTGGGLDALLATNQAYGTAAAASGGYGVAAGSADVAASAAAAANTPGAASGLLGSASSILGGLGIGYAIGTALFGTGKTSYGDAGIRGYIDGAGGAGGQTYQDWKTKGGLFSSGKSGTSTTAIPQDVLMGWQQQMLAARAPYEALDRLAGGTGTGIAGRAAAYHYEFNTKGSDTGDIIQQALAGLNSTLAPELATLAKSGETLAQVAARMTSVVDATNSLASLLGKDLRSAFGGVGIASITARNALVEAAGGLDSFKSEVDAYYNLYYTQAQKQVDTLGQFAETFAGLGVAAPKTKDEFKKLVEGLDLASESGRNAFQSLMQLAPAFAQWAEAAGNVASSLPDAYKKNFFSAQEQASMALDELYLQFATLGVDVIPKTRAEFRALVDGIDASTDSGFKLKNGLLALSDAFASATEAAIQQADEARQERLRIATSVVNERDGLIGGILQTLGKTGAMRAIDLNKTDPLNRGLAELAYTLEDATKAAQAMSAAQSAATQAQQEYTAALANAGSSIANFVKQLRSGVENQTAAGVARAYQADLAAAQSGDISASERLPASAQAYLDTLKATAGSRTEVDIAMTRMAADLSALPATKTYEQEQVRQLKALVEAVQESTAAVIDTSAKMTAALGEVISAGFAAFDLNVDQLLTFDELKQALGGIATDAQLHALIAAVDTNGDGQISKLEAVKAKTANVDDNTAALLDGSDSQVVEMRKMVAETMVNSGRMAELNASIQSLTSQIGEQNEEKKRQYAIEGKNAELSALIDQQRGMVTAVNVGIGSIWDLANRFGVYLNASESDGSLSNSAVFKVNEQGLFESQYNNLVGTGGANFAGFKQAFFASGGAYDKTYGMADDLLAMKDKIESARQAIRDLGGVPKFARGGLASGLALVGEEGPELVDFRNPGRVYTASQSAAMMAGGVDISALLEEIKGLRAEVRAGAVASVKTAKILDRVAPDGDALATRVAA